MWQSMQMKTIANSVNLNKIADSGQCFRLLNTAPHVWEYGTSFFIESTGTIITNAEHMLDLDFPYDMVDIAVQHNGNDYLKQACQYSHGIHILQQDLLEMIVTFIISQQKRIPQIRKHVLSLCVDGVFPALECLQS